MIYMYLLTAFTLLIFFIKLVIRHVNKKINRQTYHFWYHLLKGNSSVKHIASNSVKNTFRLPSWSTNDKSKENGL